MPDKAYEALTIALDGHGTDVDLAVRLGREINSYDKTDYADFSGEENPFVTIFNPGNKMIFVDVVNSLDTDAYYSLKITNEIYDSAVDMSEPMPTGDYGFIAANRNFSGILEKWDGTVVKHSFRVVVPRDHPVVVSLDGFGKDVDLALRSGQAMNGGFDNADFLDKSSKTKLEHKLTSVPEGILYIDVLSYLEEEINYSLKVSTSP